MTQNLDRFELRLVELILANNSLKYKWLMKQLPFLKVKERKFSSVGGYINFSFSDNSLCLQSDFISCELILSVPQILKVKEKDDYMSFELNVTNGYIDFMEIVVNGLWDWDGTYDKLEIIDFK